MDLPGQYRAAPQKTVDKLSTIAKSASARNLSRLTLPEIEAVVDQIARVVPAGNIPALILSGLLRVSGRRLPPNTARRDVNLLFKSVGQTLATAVYGTFFAGPAAVIWAYQNLLRLSGKDPDDAFPEGLWQFYVDYALREDTARHASETHGFDTFLSRHQIHLNTTDRVTAWVMAAMHCLHQYDAILTNEWRERVYTHLLARITQNEPEANYYAQLYREWAKQRPFGLGQDATANETYPTYRRHKFDHFLATAMRQLPADQHHLWAEQVRQTEIEDLPAYRQQMSILAYLDPGPYSESRRPIPLEKAYIGVINRGCYYLIPVCTPGTDRPAALQFVRAMVATLLADTSTRPAHLTPLAQIKRSAWPGLRLTLSETLIEELDTLRLAPILLNCDVQPRRLSLSELRQAERGLGGHALTLFDCGDTFVFDQSHIFFDAVWGTALAEIMTQQATVWVKRLINLTDPPLPNRNRPKLLSPTFLTSDLTLIQKAPRVTPEVGAETEAVDLESILQLRQRFKQRNDLLQLTVNDLLILYRAIHAVTYQPASHLMSELRHLTESSATQRAAFTALEALDNSRHLDPTVVMPVDASQRSPRDRLYPITFEVPLNDLGILSLHKRTMAALAAYEQAVGNRSNTYIEFDHLRRVYLATLGGFGVWLSKVKEIAIAGESFSASTIKLLAHIPIPLQRLLEKIPNRFDLLNDLTRGRENISNVGSVVSTSTLIRFMSAKDDNDQKTLIWGAITDAQGVMRITLRDFRPHVSLLATCGHKDLAVRLAQHYLDTYAHGLNSYIYELQRITHTSHESRLGKPEERRVQ